MRLCRFADNRLGLIEGDRVKDVSAALDVLPAARYPLPEYDLMIAHLPELRAAIAAAAGTAKTIPLSGCALLSPIANPGKIVAAPVNYKKHLEEARADPALHHQNQVAEIQRVGLFLKATSSVVGPSQGIAIRHPDRRTDHEIELAAVIGRKADRVTREAGARPYRRLLHRPRYHRARPGRALLAQVDRRLHRAGPGYGHQRRGLPTRPDLDLKLTVNGEARQKANTRDLIIGIADLIVFASSFYTLMPGDVILTGTPAGVGPIVPGDVIDASISRSARCR